jgi:translation initiation factor IF-2
LKPLHILQVTNRIPWPLNDGGNIATYNATRFLHRSGHHVELASLNTLKHFQDPAEIREVFKVTKVGNIAGCMVVDGEINRKDPIRLIRDGIVIHQGKLASLKRFKDDVREVKRGFDCGMQIDGYNDIQEKDIIEQFKTTEVARKLM